MNPQPLQARPFDDHDDHHQHRHRGHRMEIPMPIPVDDDNDGVEDSEDDDSGDETMDEVEDAPVSSRSHGDPSSSGGVSQQQPRMSELTIAFEGEVYVFHAVTPEKVQAVLLLLGGPEMPSGIPRVDIGYHQNNRAAGDASRRLDVSQRVASLVRFREKRKERCYEKKVRYTCRKEVALRQHRKKGQFVSVKQSNMGGLSVAANWDPSQSVYRDNTTHPEIPLRKCQHCGTSENSTPAMRRGPDGPRTLCNACGLMWANKGTLRDLTKSTRNISYNQSDQVNKETKTLTMEAKNSLSEQDERGNLEDTKPLPSPSETRNHSVCVDAQGAPEGLTKPLPTTMDNISIKSGNSDVTTAKSEASLNPNDQQEQYTLAHREQCDQQHSESHLR